MANDLNANITGGNQHPPSTPMIELARPSQVAQQQRPTVDELGRTKDVLQGVFIRKQVD